MIKKLCLDCSMDTLEDITDKCIALDRAVSGRDSKLWVRYKSKDVLLKIGESKAYSEHFGSTFFRSLGISAQNTCIVKFNRQVSCLIEDIVGDCTLRTFKSIHESSVDSGYIYTVYTLQDVLRELTHLKKDDVFTNSLIDRFYKMFVVDAIIANRDRHGGNWGYLINSKGEPSVSPVFDNGACMFPDLDIKEIDVNNKQQVYQLVIDSPKSQVQLLPKHKKCTFFHMFNDYRSVIDTSWLTLDNVVNASESATRGLPLEIGELWRKLAVLRYLCIVKGVPFNDAFQIYHS